MEVEKVKQWHCPEGTGVPLITMPNVPRPLHGKGMQPRTIFGGQTWNFMRKQAYYNAGYKCEICGCEPKKGDLHAHELFSYDYDKRTGKFERVVAICRTCHDGIHSGRLITLFKQGNPLYPKSYVLRVMENCFSLVHKYNKEHPDEPLKVYSTYLECLKIPELQAETEALIKKYNISFYAEDVPVHKRWKGWRVVVGKNTYDSPYTCQEDWQRAMNEASKTDNVRNLQNPFSGGVFDELEKLLDKNTQA